MDNVYNENDPSFQASTACTLSAFFETKIQAASAAARLQDVGIPQDAIRFLPDLVDSDAVGAVDNDNVWDKLESWLFPDAHRAAYLEGLRRGGFLVSVSDVNKTEYYFARKILDDEGSINIDEQADRWRKEGWGGNG